MWKWLPLLPYETALSGGRESSVEEKLTDPGMEDMKTSEPASCQTQKTNK